MADARVTVDDVPEEIWLLIFGMLDPADVLSCYHTTPNWQNWLNPKRTQFIFHKIAPIILPQLPQLDLLQLRSTCKVWKEVVDHSSQTHPSNTLFDAVEEPLTFVNRFTSSGDIQRFLQAMNSHPGNPFPGRSIAMDWMLPNTEFLRQLDLDGLHQLYFERWNNVILLLDTFGEHIQFASIRLAGSEHLGTATVLRNCLLRLSSAKCLQFVGQGDDDVDLGLENLGDNPHPQLVNLESLKIRLVTQALIVAILESFCVPETIKRLNLYDCDGVNRIPEVLYSFSNLEVLDCWLNLEDLERLARTPPPLKTFTFRVNNREIEVVNLERLFRSLEPFGETLEELHTKLSHCWRRTGLRNEFRINLPKLRSLTVDGYKGSLDPFLQLSSLTELDLWCYQGVDWMPMDGSIVQVREFEHRMEDSNIWSLLPTLNTLTIKGVGSWNRE